MSRIVLVGGKSGTGKTRSMLNLNPKSTFLANVIGKDLPFRGWRTGYTKFEKDKGNMLVSDNYQHVLAALKLLDESRKEFNVAVIDDFQYMILNEFMRRSKEKGYEKFTEIADHAWNLLWDIRFYRQDLTVFVLMHTETTDAGEVKCKTVGKLLDEKVNIEGMFTTVLTTVIEDGKFYFETTNNGHNIAKAPEGMFPEARIPNDLKYVLECMDKYEKGV